MALFKRHLTLDNLLKAIAALSPEDKEKVRAAINKDADEPAPDEDDTGTDEETPTGSDEPSSSSDETAPEEAEEKGDDVGNDDHPETAEPAETDAPEDIESEAEEAQDETTQDEEADEHGAEILKALTDRVIALEEKMQTLTELRERMEEYDTKNAEKFGYKGKPGDKLRDFADMTADELKEKILSGKH